MLIDKEIVIRLHDLTIEKHGGMKGLRSEGLLDSALNSCMMTFWGQDIYPSFEEKVARTGYAIIKNHPFVDGNKRAGYLAMLYILRVNGYEIDYGKANDSYFINGVAASQFMFDDVLKWVQSIIK